MIYFDNASASPPLENLPSFFGNCSSPHALGISAERALRQSKSFFSHLFNCSDDEVIFTSGGTESNNLAILGLAGHLRRKGGIFLTTASEHPSVLEPINFACNNPLFTVHSIPINQWLVYARDCVFASFSLVNNETGDINDIATIVNKLKKESPNIIIHIDGAQGFCKIDTPLIDVDMFSWSAHKFHGPSGVGGLMVRRNVKLQPLLHGGGQQQNLRPGTENISGIMGMTYAAEKMINQIKKSHDHVATIKTILKSLAYELPDVHINDISSQISPYILNMSFEGIKGEVLVNCLSENDIYVSMGSACRTHKKNSSPLLSMGFSKERVESAVRFSFSSMNTVEEAKMTKEILLSLIPILRNRHKKM